MKQFAGKVAWITGASSGIGEALVYALAIGGASLILSARNQTNLERVRNQCGIAKSAVHLLPLDLEDADSLESKTQQALAFFGRIDYVFHCGGFSQRSYSVDTEMSVYRRLMEVHYFGTIAITKALLPHFITQKSGHFIVISSLVGKFGSPLRTGYSAAKHALHGFFDGLRVEVKPHKIAVTIVCPGYIKTNISLNALTSTGSLHNQMDDNQANGMPVEECAQKILNAVVASKREVYIGGKELMGIYISRFFPGLMGWILQKQVVVKQKISA